MARFVSATMQVSYGRWHGRPVAHARIRKLLDVLLVVREDGDADTWRRYSCGCEFGVN